MSDSLLPPNASELEQAFERVSQRATSVDVPIASMWSPASAPSSTLPWLAWSLSVDEWGSEWPEDVKREAIASSPQVHRLKGTVGAVRRALSALGVDIELVEWWQNGGQPHTASLVAYASRNLDESGQTLLTPQIQQQIWNVVQRTKPARSHLDFSVGVSMSTGVTMGGAASSIELGRNDYKCAAPDVVLFSSVSSEGAINRSLTVERASVVSDSSCSLGGLLSVYGVPFSTIVNRLSMRAS